MNKFIKTLAATILGLTLVVGVGVGISSQQGLNSENVLAAEGTEHEIQSFTGKGVGVLLNGKAAPAKIELTNQGYPVKQVKINWTHNKSNDGVTATVSVGGTTLGSGKVGGTSTTTNTVIGDGSKSLSGDVAITFSNSMDGTGRGTLKLNQLFLIEGSGSPASNYTVTFDANGHGTAPDPEVVPSGGKVTKPADPTASGFTFGGWYTEAGCTNEYDFNTSVTSSFTLFAKWTAEGPTPVGSGFKKVTSTPSDWSGEYLLVYESDSTTANCWTGVDTSGCYAATTIINNNISAAPTGACTIIIATMNDGYSIKVNGGTNNGKYISGTSGKNITNFNEEGQLNTISYESSSVKIVSNTSVMRCNSDSSNWFRYFKSSSYTNQKPVQLYKKQAGAEVPLTDIGLPSTASVQVDSTTTLTPIKTPTNANKNDTLSWESLDPTYASVNQSGVVSGLKEGTARIRVNATDIGKSATCTVTVNPIPPVPVTHTIAQCYTVDKDTSVKFNGVYMGAYGNNPYQGIFFADGESGIMIYQVSSVPSTWEVGKTVVAVSGKTAFYNGLVQITNASFELTTATVATPVVYTFLGNETTNTILSRKSSISGTVKTVTGQTDGAFVTGADGKVTIELENGSTALIFIKKGVFTSQELSIFTEAYKVGNYVVSTGFVGYYKSGQSKDSAYDPAYWQIVVPSVVSVGKYGAVEFAQDFLADTDTICSSGSNDNLTALQAMWADTAAKYTALTSEERQKLADSSATDTDIVGAIARYKYICGKYNTDEVINLQEYIEGVIVIHNAPNVFFGVNSTDNNTMMIVIISVAVASISLLGVTIFLKKKRAIH